MIRLTVLIISILFTVNLTSQSHSKLKDPVVMSKNAPFDSSGKGIFGRKAINRSRKMDKIIPKLDDGYANYKICIDPEGKVISSDVLTHLSNMENTRYVNKAAKILMLYEFEPRDSIDFIQCGLYRLQKTTTYDY